MARPQKCRCICSMPKTIKFEPVGSGCKDKIMLGLDEYETIRLLDYETLSQEECARKMNVSRTTVTRMYDNARNKIADALVNGKRIVIDGGDIIVCKKIKPECANVLHCCHKIKV